MYAALGIQSKHRGAAQAGTDSRRSRFSYLTSYQQLPLPFPPGRVKFRYHRNLEIHAIFDRVSLLIVGFIILVRITPVKLGNVFNLWIHV